jgi:hypothetical protein
MKKEPLTIRESRDGDERREDYEAPKLEPLGTMFELTEAFSFFRLDLSGLGPSSSDRALKENFEAVDPASVLDAVRRLPVERWNYKADDPSVRHIGPMAQDFAALFEVGQDNRTITAVDANGVCLAAIQALATELEARDARIEALEAKVAALASRAAAIA